MKALEERANPVLLRRGIEDATEFVVSELRRGARDVAGQSDLAHVATIAAKEDERIGEAVARALHHVGPEGVVTIEEAELPGISVEFVEGMHVDNGHFSPYLIQDTHRMETVFDDPYILLTNKPIVHIQDLMPTLDALMKSPRPLVIFAEKVEGAALGLMVQNNQHGTLKAVAVRAPGFGHRRIAHLHDLAGHPGHRPRGPARAAGQAVEQPGGDPRRRRHRPRARREEAPLRGRARRDPRGGERGHRRRRRNRAAAHRDRAGRHRVERRLPARRRDHPLGALRAALLGRGQCRL
jgi:chaperonin GroEL